MLALLAVTIIIANGCGSSSGTGRYTIPSEITGGGDSGTVTGTGTGTGTQTDVEALLSSGWSDFGYGAYSSAINKFNEATLNANITAGQLADANNGLGWALTKANGIAAGQGYFAKAADLKDEAKLGLAAAYIQSGDYNNAKNYLVLLGLSDTSFSLTTPHAVGVSNAEAHAMLALAYFMTGDKSGAIDQMKCATANDLSSDSSVKQIRATLLSLDPTLANSI